MFCLCCRPGWRRHRPRRAAGPTSPVRTGRATRSSAAQSPRRSSSTPTPTPCRPAGRTTTTPTGELLASEDRYPTCLAVVNDSPHNHKLSHLCLLPTCYTFLPPSDIWYFTFPTSHCFISRVALLQTMRFSAQVLCRAARLGQVQDRRSGRAGPAGQGFLPRPLGRIQARSSQVTHAVLLYTQSQY